MKAYRELTRAERQTEYAAVRAAYDNQKAQGLKLNMARGKPSRDQLDLVTPMLSLITVRRTSARTASRSATTARWPACRGEGALCRDSGL